MNFKENNESNNLFSKKIINPSSNEYITSSTKNYIYNKTLENNNNKGNPEMKIENFIVTGNKKNDIVKFNSLKKKIFPFRILFYLF